MRGSTSKMVFFVKIEEYLQKYKFLFSIYVIPNPTLIPHLNRKLSFPRPQLTGSRITNAHGQTPALFHIR